MTVYFGNSPRNPSSVAAHTPRSVINPVTRRAGVTSKPGFAAGLPGAAISTVGETAIRKAAGHLQELVGGAFLDGDVPPEPSVQSMVDDGSATWNGTPLSFAASAFR